MTRRMKIAMFVPLVAQLAFVIVIILLTNGTGSFVGLGAMDLGLIALPVTAILNGIIAKRQPPRPVCPFYLRDWGAPRISFGAPSCPFGGSPPSRGTTALQMRIASAQSTLPERLRELRLRRPRRSIGAALSCTNPDRLPSESCACQKSGRRANGGCRSDAPI